MWFVFIFLANTIFAAIGAFGFISPDPIWNGLATAASSFVSGLLACAICIELQGVR